MSTIMQTHLETQFKETTTLTLKLSPSETNHNTQIDTTTAKNCWNFLELPPPKFTPYIPASFPTDKLLYSPISYVTFDLCTENLGSESGSDMSDHDIDILSLPPLLPLTSSSSSSPVVIDHPKLMMVRKNVAAVVVPAPRSSFPPPLTTIRGFNPIRVRSKREGGRLVIDAVEERSTVACNYFRSDRTNGRLRLSFWDNCPTSIIPTNQDQETEVLEEEELEAGEANVNLVIEDIIGNTLEIGVEIGTQKFQRSSRCMEGNNNKNINIKSNNGKGLCNWEPLWVAT